MKILCYGDSNTWGFPPGGGRRYDTPTRWPLVMADCLGPGYTVLEEGLNGRTIGNFMPPGNPLNGLDYLERILPTYPDLDLVVLYLGINDLFHRNDIGVEEIARNIGYAVEVIQSSCNHNSNEKDTCEIDDDEIYSDEEVSGHESAGADSPQGAATKSPEVMLLSPLPINIEDEMADFYRLLIVKSECFADECRKVAEAYDATFVETGKIISASPEDGVHIEAAEHRKLGRELCKLIKEGMYKKLH